MVAHCVYCVGCFAAGAGYARIVEKYHRPSGRQPIGYRRIPIVESTPKMLQEDKWYACFRAELPICVANAIGFDETSRGGYMSVGSHVSLQMLVGCE